MALRCWIGAMASTNTTVEGDSIRGQKITRNNCTQIPNEKENEPATKHNRLTANVIPEPEEAGDAKGTGRLAPLLPQCSVEMEQGEEKGTTSLGLFGGSFAAAAAETSLFGPAAGSAWPLGLPTACVNDTDTEDTALLSLLGTDGTAAVSDIQQLIAAGADVTATSVNGGDCPALRCGRRRCPCHCMFASTRGVCQCTRRSNENTTAETFAAIQSCAHS